MAGTVVTRLLAAILAASDGADVDDVMTFTPDPDGLLSAAFAGEGFALRPFEYLCRPIEPSTPPPSEGLGSFHAGRLLALADLLARAYPGADQERPFAPGGTREEWVEYTSQLVTQNGCGTVLPWASVVEEDPQQRGRLLGAIVTTRIAGQSAHLAQVAIDPAVQGRGRGRRLLEQGLARLSDRGYTHVSLLVAADNRPALSLYRALGFERQGAFVSAWRRQPRRSTSAACSTGGVSTFR